MNTDVLIETLDQQFGNQYAPQRYLIIQEAVAQLRLLQAEVNALRSQVNEK